MKLNYGIHIKSNKTWRAWLFKVSTRLDHSKNLKVKNNSIFINITPDWGYIKD